MNQKEMYRKAQLLKAGQIVEIAGDYYRAVQVEDWTKGSCCEQCDLDSNCRDDVHDVCVEMETTASYKWLLKLAHNK